MAKPDELYKNHWQGGSSFEFPRLVPLPARFRWRCLLLFLLHQLECFKPFAQQASALQGVSVLVMQRNLTSLLGGVLAVLPLFKLGTQGLSCEMKGKY